jgi:hypothetical protein
MTGALQRGEEPYGTANSDKGLTMDDLEPVTRGRWQTAPRIRVAELQKADNRPLANARARERSC